MKIINQHLQSSGCHLADIFCWFWGPAFEIHLQIVNGDCRDLKSSPSQWSCPVLDSLYAWMTSLSIEPDDGIIEPKFVKTSRVFCGVDFKCVGRWMMAAMSSDSSTFPVIASIFSVMLMLSSLSVKVNLLQSS
ncbi:uncharacterized protein [Clytia hemisphaerica]|uniref:uncharacterized protein n=1 Tax=Clytia hemisphaerica TaxID=252671 RepID=UPI0034D4088B